MRTASVSNEMDINSEVTACYSFQARDQAARRQWIASLKAGDELWFMNGDRKLVAARFRTFHGTGYVVVELLNGLMRGKLKKVRRVHLRKEVRLY